jgi:hypothetical protein
LKRIQTRICAMGELDEAERAEFAKWAWRARSRTTFDLDIIGHSRAVMFIAENGNRTAYLPVHTVLMAESFIPRPELGNRDKAYSLGMFDRALIESARKLEIKSVYCFVPECELDYIEKVQRHGWMEVPQVRLFRKSVT